MVNGDKKGESKGGVNGSGVEEVLDLGFGKCKLQVQVPEDGRITDPRELVGRNVVTSFTGLTERYFRALEDEVLGEDGEVEGENGKEEGKRKLKTNIMYVGGSVEAACALGVADGIVDLVGTFLLPYFPIILTPDLVRQLSLTRSYPESGETMRAAGLTPLSTVLPSTAVLIKSTKPSNPALVSLITSRIKGVITAQSFVLCQYNIPRDLLSKATEITPGKRAPTVTALEEEGWVAISSMVPKKDVAGVMDRLTDAGATDVLVLEISNSRAS